MKDKRQVDNSSDGNCMYYAYSISLMDFLRHEPPETANKVFKNLELDEQPKLLEDLKEILDKKAPFELEDIKKIENILGPITRKVAADRTALEFEIKPRSSSLFAAAGSYIELQFKTSFESPSHGPDEYSLGALIKDSYNTQDFKTAEIFNVEGIKDRMKKFVSEEIISVKQLFTKEWGGIQGSSLSEKESKQKKQNILNKILQDKTSDFFLNNTKQELATYVDHLNTNFRWGTEETLFALNRAVSGEKFNYVSSTKRFEAEYDVNINLQILIDGKQTFQPNVRPDIIMNNINNCHWTSFLYEPLSEIRKKFLEEVNFSSALKELFFEAEKYSHKEKNPNKKSLLYNIYTQLYNEKERFIKIDEKNAKPNDLNYFIDNCRNILNSIPLEDRTKLYEITRLRTIIFKMLNILIFIGTLGIANLITRKLTIVEPSTAYKGPTLINIALNNLQNSEQEMLSIYNQIKDVKEIKKEVVKNDSPDGQKDEKIEEIKEIEPTLTTTMKL